MTTLVHFDPVESFSFVFGLKIDDVTTLALSVNKMNHTFILLSFLPTLIESSFILKYDPLEGALMMRV